MRFGLFLCRISHLRGSASDRKRQRCLRLETGTLTSCRLLAVARPMALVGDTLRLAMVAKSTLVERTKGDRNVLDWMKRRKAHNTDMTAIRSPEGNAEVATC